MAIMPMDLRRRRCSSDNVCETRPWRGRLREYPECLVGSCPGLWPSVNQLASSLRCPRISRNHSRVDLDKSCTANAADSGFLLAERSQRNISLLVVNIELRKGRLTAACLRRRAVPAALSLQHRHSVELVYWILMDYRCVDIVELCESHMSPNKFLFRSEFQLIRKLRPAKLCYHLLDDNPPRNLTDSLRSPVTTFDMLESRSVRFSRVSIHEPSELPDRFETMRALLFRENKCDVPDAEALIRCCTTHRSQEKIHVDETFKLIVCCYVLAELVSRSAVIEKLVMSRCVHSAPHEFAALTGSRAVGDRCELLGTFEMQNFEQDDADIPDLSSALNISAYVKTPNVTCTTTSPGLQLTAAPDIWHVATLGKIYMSGYLVPVDFLRERTIEVNATLKKLTVSQACLNRDYDSRLVDALSVNWMLELSSLGTVVQPGLGNFWAQVGERDQRSRIELTCCYAATDEVIGCLQCVLKISHVPLELPVFLAWPEYQELDHGFYYWNANVWSLLV
ncbi:uncharacterized protein [Dermacentor albipictus]|uniref:uncharacterized protein n=1 Tax=Dermacentor albipictus TaxID=60249 RepID=UPI0038FC94FC